MLLVRPKKKEEIDLMREAGHIVYRTHQYLKQYIKPGVTTKELDDKAAEYMKSQNAYPSCKGYEGFPANNCISINDQVVHGIPDDTKLKDGDIVTLDLCACYKGFHGDSAWTYPVGHISKEREKLLKLTEESLYEGLKQVKPGNKIGDIGHAIEKFAIANHLGVVKELCGHGIGKNLHEKPDVLNYGEANTGYMLKEGMTIAIEPMLTVGSPSIFIDDDNGWTIYTMDGSDSAHFEHTIVVTHDGYEILTKE